METIPVTNGHTFIKLWFPVWLPAFLAVELAVAPWSSLMQFSFRTLHVATTLVAMLLGLAVWR